MLGCTHQPLGPAPIRACAHCSGYAACTCAPLQAAQAVIDLEQQLREKQGQLERAQEAERETSAAEEEQR